MLERKHTPRYPAELRVRGVRLIKENRSNYSSDSAAYASIAEKLGCSRFPLPASRMVHPGGARRRRAAGPEYLRQESTSCG